LDRNFLLALALSFAVLTVWTIYTTPAQKPAPEGAPPATTAPLTPGATGETGAQTPSAPTVETPRAAPAAPVAPPPIAQLPAQEQRVTVETDRVRAIFTTRGGAIVHWELRDFDDAYQPGRPRVELTTFDTERAVGLFTPLDSLGYGDLRFAPYRVESSDAQGVTFVRELPGVKIRKIYRLEPDSYLLALRIELENRSDRTLRPTFQVGWPTVGRTTHDWAEMGLAAYTDGGLEHIRLGPGGAPMGGMFGGGSHEPVEYPADVDWAGADTRYFLAAMISDVPRETAARLAPAFDGAPATVEIAQRAVDLPPGQMAARDLRVYLGPKESRYLDAAGGHLDQAVQKGWFPALTNFFTAVLVATYKVVPNYGVAIILITVVVRLLMFPIMQRQMRSMKRMSAIAPRMKEIQEQYKDDKERQSQEVMKLYKESGFNPLTGCLPMLLQLPVFIGLYYALQNAIALRQEPFFAWIHDLSAPEALFMIPGLELPVRVLPILMGGSMVLQSRLTPTTMDPVQARMMNTIMPLMFTFMFYQFASGLVLYWLVSNLLGIAQQLLVNRNADK
jgi:YidC/Oxa1 family membrane protein insertase